MAQTTVLDCWRVPTAVQLRLAMSCTVCFPRAQVAVHCAEERRSWRIPEQQYAFLTYARHCSAMGLGLSANDSPVLDRPKLSCGNHACMGPGLCNATELLSTIVGHAGAADLSCMPMYTCNLVPTHHVQASPQWRSLNGHSQCASLIQRLPTSVSVCFGQNSCTPLFKQTVNNKSEHDYLDISKRVHSFYTWRNH